MNLPELSKWTQDVQSWIKEIKEQPTIEAYSAMLCSESFNHHAVHPVMTQDTKKTLDYWGYDHPDVVMTIKKDNYFSYSKKDKLDSKKLHPTPVGNDFFMVRIADEAETKIGPDNLQEHSFIDLKVTGMTQDEFKQLVLSLPVFWLELHSTVRQPDFNIKDKDIMNSQLAFYQSNPLVRNLSDYKLQSFYSPSREYQRMKDGRLENQTELLENIGASIPFDFGSNVLANHLYFLSAGKVQPLTRAQELWAVQCDANQFLQISIMEDVHRTNIIAIEEPELKTSSNINATWLESYTSPVVDRFNRFVNQVKPDFNYETNPSYLIIEDNIAFNYEKTMLAYFHVLTTIDHDFKSSKKKKLFN